MTDRRDHFATPRVAHTDLRGQTQAPRFSAGRAMRVAAPIAGLFATQDGDALDRQLRFGQGVTVLEQRGARAFVRADAMGFVGYMDPGALIPSKPATHVVTARSTLAFAKPDFKAPAPLPLSLGSLLTIVSTQGRYARCDTGSWVMSAHLAPLTSPASDPAEVAQKLIGTPYLWGGNSAFGIDCSGLVELALNMCGLPCPGDSDQQAQRLGPPLPQQTTPRRGDLLFWRGHVAMAIDARTLVHANAYHMAVALEPIDVAIARIAQQGDGPVTHHLRPSGAPDAQKALAPTTTERDPASKL